MVRKKENRLVSWIAGLALSWAAGLCDRALCAEASPLIGDGPNPAQALSLERALELALAGNLELQAENARLGIATGRALQSSYWPNPELELSAEDWPMGGGGINEAQRLVGVAQTVPFPGKKRLDRQIGGAEVRAAEAGLRGRRRALIHAVRQAFAQALAAERSREVATELTRVAESAAVAARKRVEAGDAADSEQLRAELSLERARSELLAYQRDRALAGQRLAALLGPDSKANQRLAGELAESADLSALDRSPADWLAVHPEREAARTVWNQAQLEWRRARLEPYPDVKVGVAGGREGGGGSIAEVRLSLPLPLIDRAKGQRRAAQARTAAAEAELRGVEQRLLREWAMAAERLRTAAAQASAYREQILPRSVEALRLVQLGFEQGKFGLTDLLDTQRAAAEARLGYLQRLLELNLAQADVEALRGPAGDAPQRSPVLP